MTIRTILVALGCLICAGAASGQEFNDPAGCLARQAGAQQPVADCVQEVHAPCLDYPQASASGTACFVRAKEAWGALIAGRMDSIQAKAPPEIASIAGIEVKYDLRGNFMQCERLEELSLVARDPGEDTLYARARCEATAVGLAYAKLWLQSRAVE